MPSPIPRKCLSGERGRRSGLEFARRISGSATWRGSTPFCTSWNASPSASPPAGAPAPRGMCTRR
ncbi:MAG: hypothetical protein ACFFD2_04350 [Promethearchaeota archaeon]